MSGRHTGPSDVRVASAREFRSAAAPGALPDDGFYSRGLKANADANPEFRRVAAMQNAVSRPALLRFLRSAPVEFRGAAPQNASTRINGGKTDSAVH